METMEPSEDTKTRRHALQILKPSGLRRVGLKLTGPCLLLLPPHQASEYKFGPMEEQRPGGSAQRGRGSVCDSKGPWCLQEHQEIEINYVPGPATVPKHKHTNTSTSTTTASPKAPSGCPKLRKRRVAGTRTSTGATASRRPSGRVAGMRVPEREPWR